MSGQKSSMRSPRVAIIGGILNLTTIIPFIEPKIAPTTIPPTNDCTSVYPLFIREAVAIDAAVATAARDRSRLPDISNMVTDTANIPLIDIARDIFKKFLLVKKYSDHIAQPVSLKSAKKDEEDKVLNNASALWTRDKKDITVDQYKEFYHHVGMAYDDPWLTLHNKAEGLISYINLLFIPSTNF